MKATTIQPPPQDKPFMSESELNALSAIYMLAVIAMIIGIGIYGAHEAINTLYRRHQLRRGLKQMEQIITMIKKQESKEAN